MVKKLLLLPKRIAWLLVTFFAVRCTHLSETRAKQSVVISPADQYHRNLTVLNNTAAYAFQWPPEKPVVVNIFRVTSVPIVTPGMQVALERVQLNKTLRDAFEFRVSSVVLPRETNGETGAMLRTVVTSIMDDDETYDILIGSDSSVENLGLAQMTPIYNLVQFCVYCRAAAFLDTKVAYPTLVRDSPNARDYTKTVLALMTALKVESIATVTAADSVIIENIRIIEDSLLNDGKNIMYSGIISYASMSECITDLQRVKPNYVLAMLVSLPTPKMICEIYLRNILMPDTTIYILVGPFLIPKFWIPNNQDEPGTPVWNCTEMQMARALQGSFVIDIHVDVSPQVKIGGLTHPQLKDRLRYYANQSNLPLLFPSGTYHMYDLTWSAIDGLYRTAVRMSEQGSTVSFQEVVKAAYRTPERQKFREIYLEEIRKTRFFGSTGDYVYDNNNNRYVNLRIDQFHLNASNSSNVFVTPVSVGMFRAMANVVVLDEHLFEFATPNGQPPGQWLTTRAETITRAAYVRLVIILTVVGFVVLAAISGAAIYLYARHHASKADTSWLIPFQNIGRVRLCPSYGFAGPEAEIFSYSRGRGILQRGVFSGVDDRAKELQVWMRVVPITTLGSAANTFRSKRSMSAEMKLSDRQRLLLNQLVPQAGTLRSLYHPNLVKFVGLCLDYGQQTRTSSGTAQLAEEALILYEWTSKGAIWRHIRNFDFDLCPFFKNSFMFDSARGLQFIQGKYSPNFGGAHGFLHTHNIVVSHKFSAKLTDFGFWQCRPSSDFEPVSEKLLEQASVAKLEFMLLNRAPEFLREGLPCIDCLKQTNLSTKRGLKKLTMYGTQSISGVHGLQRGDVYSFGMVLVELFTRRPPFLYDNPDPSKETLIDLIWFAAEGKCAPQHSAPALISPQALALSTAAVDDDSSNLTKEHKQLILECTHKDPLVRPTINEIVRRIEKLPTFTTVSIVDSLVEKLNQYATKLELVVEQRTKALAEEMQRSEQLLLQILPRSVAEELKQGRHVPPELFDAVSIYFSDIVGFTKISSESSPTEVVEMLNGLYTLFDAVLGNFDVYKVETIGDAYMVSSGLPVRNGNKHLSQIAHMSLKLLETISKFVIAHRPQQSICLRIGLHTGPCAAGVVGIKMPRYCLFGDSVNTASRMESTGEAKKIHISQTFCTELHRKFPDEFITTERGEINVKGKGVVETSWLSGAKTKLS